MVGVFPWLAWTSVSLWKRCTIQLSPISEQSIADKYISRVEKELRFRIAEGGVFNDKHVEEMNRTVFISPPEISRDAGGRWGGRRSRVRSSTTRRTRWRIAPNIEPTRKLLGISIGGKERRFILQYACRCRRLLLLFRSGTEIRCLLER